jgi:hypothetical protein
MIMDNPQWIVNKDEWEEGQRSYPQDMLTSHHLSPFKWLMTRYNFSFKHKGISSLCDQEKVVLFQFDKIIW